MEAVRHSELRERAREPGLPRRLGRPGARLPTLSLTSRTVRTRRPARPDHRPRLFNPPRREAVALRVRRGAGTVREAGCIGLPGETVREDGSRACVYIEMPSAASKAVREAERAVRLCVGPARRLQRRISGAPGKSRRASTVMSSVDNRAACVVGWSAVIGNMPRASTGARGAVTAAVYIESRRRQRSSRVFQSAASTCTSARLAAYSSRVRGAPGKSRRAGTSWLGDNRAQLVRAPGRKNGRRRSLIGESRSCRAHWPLSAARLPVADASRRAAARSARRRRTGRSPRGAGGRP